MLKTLGKLLILLIVASSTTSAQSQHQRIAQTETPGRRVELNALKGAVLFVGPVVNTDGRVPLVIHFHGAPWLVEQHIAKNLSRAALITVQLGAGSSVYGRPFDRTATFRAMIDEARDALKLKHNWSSITLTGFSAGYGAVRAILRDEANVSLVDNVLLLDGIHASYSPEGKLLADGGTINENDLDSFVRFARLAAAGKKSFVITHSQIFPAAYASTTECSNFLLTQLGLDRRLESRVEPNGMHQLSTANVGRFHVRGYSGNTAADHVDHIHSMPAWFGLLKIK